MLDQEGRPLRLPRLLSIVVRIAGGVVLVLGSEPVGGEPLVDIGCGIDASGRFGVACAPFGRFRDRRPVGERESVVNAVDHFLNERVRLAFTILPDRGWFDRCERIEVKYLEEPSAGVPTPGSSDGRAFDQKPAVAAGDHLATNS